MATCEASAGKRVIVVGAGFGGLEFCREFRVPGVEIVLIDRRNHFLFQPLLYQVATAGLSMPEIAMPLRGIFSGRKDVTVLMDEVQAIDLEKRTVEMRRTGKRLRYDYLVIAVGAKTHYYGHPEWAQHTYGLKTLEDAHRIRTAALMAFEQAETTEEIRKKLLTFVVVGGGPTGVEMAGSIAELARHVLRKDFRHIDPASARIVLLEVSDRILGAFDDELSAAALRQLESLGVEVRAGVKIERITRERVYLKDTESIEAGVIVWAAGVRAVDLCQRLGVSVDGAGRLLVESDTSLPGHPEVFGIGDCVALKDARGRVVPGVSPAAMQMGRHVARIIARELRTGAGVGPELRVPFVYRDKGMMATIGRSRAVAAIGRLRVAGFPAWLLWLFVHLVFLVGYRNKLVVLIQWFYSYVTFRRGARILTEFPEPEERDVDR